MQLTTLKQLRSKQFRNGIIMFVAAYIVGCLVFACWECGPAKKYFDDAACNFQRDILIATVGVLKVIFGLGAICSAVFGLAMSCQTMFCPEDFDDELKKLHKRERKEFTNKQK